MDISRLPGSGLRHLGGVRSCDLEGALNLGVIFPIALLFGLIALVFFLWEGLKSRKKLRQVFFAALMAPVASIAIGRRPVS
ncbi:cbb3-type cytochrome oxidase maturation protein [Rhizobium sp. BK376]|nr:cbb3-type cytochrome oxidase maturation protein [Rhizobium sp. BK376]